MHVCLASFSLKNNEKLKKRVVCFWVPMPTTNKFAFRSMCRVGVVEVDLQTNRECRAREYMLQSSSIFPIAVTSMGARKLKGNRTERRDAKDARRKRVELQRSNIFDAHLPQS